MRTQDIKKEDYFLVGATETALIYVYGPIFGAFKSVRDDFLAYFLDDIMYIYASVKGLRKAKNKILKSSSTELEKKSKRWSEKWIKHDKELYEIAIGKKRDWRKNWRRVNALAEGIFTESYKSEIFDNFSDEIREFLINKIKKPGLKTEILNELILPDVPTKVQEIISARKKVKNKTISGDDFIRKYWYIYGFWGGGKVLDKKRLGEDLKEKNEELNFKNRKKIHQQAERKLERDTNNLIKILRLFALWREERKTYAQRLSLAYESIIVQAAEELKVSKKAVSYAFYEEAGQIKNNEKKFLSRSQRCVLFFKKKSKKGVILPDKEANFIIEKFKKVEAKELKGMTACKGKAKGIAKVIIKNSEFKKFKKGDILVTTMTRPEFIPLIKIAAAIITEEGGLTSHAAIVSREFNTPCIVGAKNVTQLLQSGDLVEVDADKETIKIVRKKNN